MHHLGSDGDLAEYVKDIEKIVRQEGAVFGEFPDYEPGHYTFLADYLPYSTGDGMEHRNSTVMTEAASIATGRRSLLDTVAHEFFHGWNVERIRPRSIEPFDFERANMSSELWLAEGFTQYYGKLIVQRAGLADLRATSQALTEFVETAAVAPGRAVRSAEEMSRMAPFMDGGTTVDRTNWPNSVTSYYPLGGAIALALDLTLRGRSGSEITLDDFMRAMWREHGKPGGARAGLRRPALHGRRRGSAAGGGERRPGVRARFFQPLHPGTRGRRLSGAAGTGGIRRPPAQPRPRLVGRRQDRAAQRPDVHCRAGAGEFAGLRRRSRAGR